MKTINMSIDDTIRHLVEEHVQRCIKSINDGFRVVEVEVPLQYAPKVFTHLNEEISYGKRMTGWQFGVFSRGEFEGKMAQRFTIDGALHNRYFLKYTL